MMGDGCNSAEQVPGDPKANSLRSWHRLYRGDSRSMSTPNSFRPFDIVTVRPASELLVCIELEMIVRIDQTRESDSIIKYNFPVAGRRLSSDLTYSLAVDNNIANSGIAEDFNVAEDRHVFVKTMPNTKRSPLYLSYSRRARSRSNNGLTESSMDRSEMKDTVSPHFLAMFCN